MEYSYCSDVPGEPLPGTAKTGHMYVIFEKPGPWSRDILDGGTFDAETTKKLKEFPGFYLIRKHGREGHIPCVGHQVYLAFCDEGITEELKVNSVDELFDLDLSGPGRNADKGAKHLEDPLLMVCTHAKRDVCCAIKGRPIAEALIQRYPEKPIWECSHTKGHRFAPSLVLFPYGYSFGRLNAQAAIDMYAMAETGVLFLGNNRGRGSWNPRGQVAEIAVANELAQHGRYVRMGELEVEDTADPIIVRDRDIPGARWAVELAQTVIPDIMASCGTDPKPSKAWLATEIRAL